MSQTGPFFGFSLRDTLTRLIPGLLFLSPLIISLTVFMPSLLPEGSLRYIILGLFAYLIGEFIDQLRLGLFRVPQSFRYFVYKETQQLEKMPIWFIYAINVQEYFPNRLNFYEEFDEDKLLTNNLELDFREDLETELGVDFDNDRPKKIYDLLLIYMDGHFTPRLRRLQSVSIFSTNLRISVAGILLISVLYMIGNWGSPFFSFVLGFSAVLAVVVIMFWSVLTMTQQQYSELLFKEYYMKRFQDQES
ncbi:hypothetical protein [Haloarcula sp. CBA1131]|uniref:hypothetical protein n=1 Tax=Haloarcula sp. CBA1131 TaxID=1853686 RepID=UPI001243DCFF|nr:hypothetical protein [Haloarcula sp. CBA1131]